MKNLNILAFDLGASSGRGILGSFNGSTLKIDEIHRFPNEPVSVNGSFYWDVLRLYHEMKQGIAKCAANGYKGLAGIGVDTWGVDFGLLDEHGRLLGNPFHYRDRKNEGMMEEAFMTVSQREIYQTTGIAFQKFNTLYQLLAMKNVAPSILDKGRTMLFMPDLFNYFLTGEKVCEYTIASTSQMYDVNEGSWAYDLVLKLGIPRSILVDITRPCTIIGRLTCEVSHDTGMEKVPVIAVAGHDTASAVASVPAAGSKYAYLSSGTWSLIGIESETPIINDTTYSLNYTNEGGITNRFRVLRNIMGLWIYQECRRTWAEAGNAPDFRELEELAQKSKPFESFIDPDNDMFYSPGNMPEKIREFCRNTRQRVPEDKGAIVRCILESLALKYRMALEGLEKIAGYSIPVIHVVGGGCKNVMLNQFTANATGKDVVAGPVEATAVGNLIGQLIALGEVADLNQGREVVRRSFSTVDYKPADGAQWDEAYQRFLSIIQ